MLFDWIEIIGLKIYNICSFLLGLDLTHNISNWLPIIFLMRFFPSVLISFALNYTLRLVSDEHFIKTSITPIDCRSSVYLILMHLIYIPNMFLIFVIAIGKRVKIHCCGIIVNYPEETVHDTRINCNCYIRIDFHLALNNGYFKWV